jgi:hypothetical protein
MRVTSGFYLILRAQVLEVRPSSTAGCRGPRGAQAGRVYPRVAALMIYENRHRGKSSRKTRDQRQGDHRH